MKYLLVVASLILYLTATAQEASLDSPSNLTSPQKVFEKAFTPTVFKTGITLSQMSFYVQPINQSSPLLSLNAQRAQNPASVIKLITSYAALNTLGANYQWRTQLLSTGQPDGQGTLHTPLYLKGSGDPQLVIEKIDELVAGLARSGVKNVQSPIIIDRSVFNDERQDAASFDGEPSMPYNAQPDAALMNYRAIGFTFDPVLKMVSAVPALYNYPVNNNLEWVDGVCPATGWKSTVNLSVSTLNASISGRYYSDCGTNQWHVHAYQMTADTYVQRIFGTLMQRDVSVSYGVTPQSAQPLAEVLSNHLPLVLKDMNGFSNNVMARQIYLSLSAQQQGIGSLAGSAQVVRRVLKQKGLSFEGLNMGNGSGLSRQTRVRAADLGYLLVTAAHDDSFVDSLPILGVSGTVKNRLLDTDMVGRGRIKTGTLDTVRAIAGYIDGKSGQRYAIVSIIEGQNAQTAAAKKLHDEFMIWVGNQ
jgi:D-alanyl-D-alanine carboxypeptidase/D-alanyl-D-alanine-endopeptidase (penicillin-binding protein 4)